MAVDHGVAKTDGAVVVGRRRDGEGPVAVVGDCAMVRAEPDIDRVSLSTSVNPASRFAALTV
jgi:hypothetical protein